MYYANCGKNICVGKIGARPPEITSTKVNSMQNLVYSSALSHSSCPNTYSLTRTDIVRTKLVYCTIIQ